jgi:hypothetical protein
MKGSDDEKGNKNIFHTTNIVTIENMNRFYAFINVDQVLCCIFSIEVKRTAERRHERHYDT